jgi:hypothetical protein
MRTHRVFYSFNFLTQRGAPCAESGEAFDVGTVRPVGAAQQGWPPERPLAKSKRGDAESDEQANEADHYQPSNGGTDGAFKDMGAPL